MNDLSDTEGVGVLWKSFYHIWYGTSKILMLNHNLKGAYNGKRLGNKFLNLKIANML